MNSSLEIITNAQNILKSITIPAQPQTVLELTKLINTEDVDLKKIISKVEKDPSLTAKVLKIANSPMFGLRKKVDSISQAINLIGFSIFQKAVLSAAIRDIYIYKPSPICDSFWNHSEIAACCCEIIAKKIQPKLTQKAYLIGLFHDCMIPVMHNKYSDYDDLIRRSLHYKNSILAEEEKRYSTNHSVMGYLMAKSWQLPDSVCISILRHHDEEPLYSDNAESRILNAILLVSEFIIQDYDSSGNMKTISITKWSEIYEKTLDVLNIEPNDIIEFENKLLDRINN